MTEQVAQYTSRVAEYAVVMPNTTPPIGTVEEVKKYQEFYKAWLGDSCTLLLTAKLLPTHTPKDIDDLIDAGVIGFKLYPSGVTTNSNDGIPAEWLSLDYSPMPQFEECLKQIAERDSILLQHGEQPDAFCLNREQAYLGWMEETSHRIPTLRMTLEHISTEAGIHLVKELHRRGRKVLGTVTPHHLLYTLNDLLGEKLKPHLFCKPLLKTPDDQYEIYGAVMNSTQSCFALGSDSAPHTLQTKECAEGCAGVYNAPVLLQVIWQTICKYTDQYRREIYNTFCWRNACDFYRVPYPKQTVTLVNEPWKIPVFTNPRWMCAGETLEWQIAN